MIILRNFEEFIYSLLRAVSGFLFLQHGIQKIFGGLDGKIATFGSIYWFAGMIELVGGILILVGLFTAIAAFISSGTMAVAYFGWHAHKNFWPILNNGELSALYAFVFLYLAARGDGKFSLMRFIKKT
ncbi:MAG: DoxX family protein [Leptospiraceae bacterium]|nr:DoxX family protein [Leptospiraceae bacterium]MDW7975235.1 DoxX family protein [Leptospiraceae bacterium]